MMHDYRTVQAFHQLAIEGMVLAAPRVEPSTKPVPLVQPLVHRCECGKPISNGRHYCRACLTAAVERVVTAQADAATVAKVAQQSTSEQRVAIIAELQKRQAPKPHLDPDDPRRLP